jgi:hypothetical protein
MEALMITYVQKCNGNDESIPPRVNASTALDNEVVKGVEREVVDSLEGRSAENIQRVVLSKAS